MTATSGVTTTSAIVCPFSPNNVIVDEMGMCARAGAWVFVAGCYNATPRAGAPCDTSMQCPGNQECVEGVCGGTASGDAAVEPDASPSDALEVDAAPDGPPPQMLQFVIDQPGQIRDTFVWSATPGEPHGDEPQVSVDTEDSETTLVWFDLSAIPANAQVVTATFKVRTDDEADEGGGTVLVYPLLETWSELDATWLLRAPSMSWSAVGARPPSRATTAIGSFSPAAVNTSYNVALSPAAVQGWIAQPATNRGFALVRGTSTQHVHLFTKESQSQNRPSLRLDVLVP
jgi:hypothetical protein